jgi:hypothetical protein
VTGQLELSDEARSDAAAVTSGVLTNRWNLLEFLSRRLITPFGSFEKYYDDLLRYEPGAVPIVDTPLSQELVAAVCGPDAEETVFPVFLELGSVKDRSPQVVETAQVVALHFRSQRDLDEHAARDFDNVPPGPPLVVSPSLFDGGDGAIPSPAASTGDTDELLSELRLLDRFTGAVALAAVEEVGTSNEAQALARLMDGGAWGDASCPWLATISSRVHGTPPPPIDSPNDRLMARLCERLVELDVLGDPVRFARALLEELGDGPGAEDLQPGLSRIIDILDGEADFQRFTEKGLAVVKATLMLLMRPEPGDLVEWTIGDSGADPATRLTALFLCGLLHGRRVLSTRLRPEGLDAALAAWEARRVAHQASVACKVSSSGRSHEVTQKGETLRVLVEPDQPLPELLAVADLEQVDIAKACAELAVRHGWTDLVTTIVEIPDGCVITVGGRTVEVPGVPVIRRRLVAEELLRRLADPVTWTGPEADRLRTMIDVPVPKRRPRQK